MKLENDYIKTEWMIGYNTMKHIQMLKQEWDDKKYATENSRRKLREGSSYT
jgi:hypothetical protein